MAGPVGWYGRPVRLGSLPDARGASGRSLCFEQSRRSQHVTTREKHNGYWNREVV